MDVSRNEAVKKGMEDMKGLGQSIADKNLKTGIRQGIQQGIMELLSELGEVSTELSDAIYSQTDLDTLKNWLKLAAKAEAINDFVDKMQRTK